MPGFLTIDSCIALLVSFDETLSRCFFNSSQPLWFLGKTGIKKLSQVIEQITAHDGRMESSCRSLGILSVCLIATLKKKKEKKGFLYKHVWLILLCLQFRKSSEASHLPIPFCLPYSNLKQKIPERSHTGEQSSF